jgi:hypothetical protein
MARATQTGITFQVNTFGMSPNTKPFSVFLRAIFFVTCRVDEPWSDQTKRLK